jgi:hypothetical protein
MVESVISDTLYNNEFVKANFMAFSYLNSKMIIMQFVSVSCMN